MDNRYQILRDIVKVKNATLIYDTQSKLYSIVHYDTEIAQIKDNNEIIKVLKCSSSSSRAIYQLTDYLGIDRKTVKANLKPYYNFVKYSFGN